MNSGFKSKAEEIEWRRSKVLELKSQGLDQREIANTLHVQGRGSNLENYTVKEKRPQYGNVKANPIYQDDDTIT